MDFETLNSIRRRLAGCASCEQIKAVQQSVTLINKATGVLDGENGAAAIFALAVAIAGCDEAAYQLITNTNNAMNRAL